MEPNIWSTLECYCWAAGMSYEKDYLVFHKRGNHKYTPLCKEAYEAFKKAMDIQLMNDECMKEAHDPE